MKTGIVFDIKEFAVYDGPGIRTTVFLKGCPLRCMWCHNPEGLSPRPQLMVSRAACVHCGKCAAICKHESCIACGECVSVCTLGLRRIAGTAWQADDLARRLLKNREAFDFSGGGVTFSGGEPLMQWAFIDAVLDGLPDIHSAIETSGYAPDKVFAQAQRRLNLIMMDLKLMDGNRHRHYTGVDNGPILRHLAMLKVGSTPYIIRVPLIPGVNDSFDNLEQTAAALDDPGPLLRVELLPYHQTAGAKYDMAGMRYHPEFDVDQRPQAHTRPFTQRGIDVKVL